jgi:hypothetical protein
MQAQSLEMDEIRKFMAKNEKNEPFTEVRQLFIHIKIKALDLGLFSPVAYRELHLPS